MRVSSSMALKHDTRVPQVPGTPGTESQQQDQHGFTLSSFSPSAQKGICQSTRFGQVGFVLAWCASPTHVVCQISAATSFLPPVLLALEFAKKRHKEQQQETKS